MNNITNINPLARAVDSMDLSDYDDSLTAEQEGALALLDDFSAKLAAKDSHKGAVQDLVKGFNKQSHYLRMGLLGKQYLQGVPNFRKQMELDNKLAEVYEQVGGDINAVPVEWMREFIKEWLLPATVESKCLKAQRTNRKWPASYNVIQAHEKADLIIEWLGLASQHLSSVNERLADTVTVQALAPSIAERTHAPTLTPQILVAFIAKEEKVTQAVGLKGYALAYLNLCFQCYAEIGEWDSLAAYFDPKGQAEAEGFANMEREIADFAGLLSADGLLDEL